MTRHLKAIDEGGVFRPREPVEIAEHQEVSLLLETPDEEQPDTETDMPIWEYAAQLMRDIPEDALKALPTDGSATRRNPRLVQCYLAGPTISQPSPPSSGSV